MADIEATARRLEALATQFDDHDSQAAGRFRELADDLRRGESAALDWAFSNIHSIFDAEKLASRREILTQHDGPTTAEAARNILVLLPLAITWLGIAWAVSAFSSLMHDQPLQAAQSFIYLWQTGFDGRMPFTLERLALVDGLLLLLVFILTIYVYVKGSGKQRVMEYDSAGLQAEIETTLADVDRALAVHRLPQAAIGVDLVRQAAMSNVAEVRQLAESIVKTIGQEYDRFQGLAKRREEEIISLNSFTTQLDRAGERMQAVATTLQQAHAETLQNVHNLQTPITSLAQHTSKLAEHTDRVIPTVTKATEQLTHLVKGQNEAVMGLRDLASQQEAVAKGVSAGIGSLQDAADEAAQATSALSSASQHLSDEQDRLISALGRERQAQADLAILVSQSNYDLGEVLKQFKDQATLVHGIASDVTWASQRFQTLDEILRSLQTGLKHVVDSQQASASQIAAATNRIEVAASNFEQTVQSLGQAATSLANSTVQLAQVVSAQAVGTYSQRS